MAKKLVYACMDDSAEESEIKAVGVGGNVQGGTHDDSYSKSFSVPL